ncbi:MAG TPA: DUF1761 domain-containing protein [Flavipsychrobacter sp.]|nr:DUF1761 domain-containing protein [Flavipsychrobacter sp.]
MPNYNMLAVLVAALLPLIIGFIWYHPKVLGNAWMQAAGLNEEKLKGGKMGFIFLLCFIFSFLIAFQLQYTVIHQLHYYSILAGEQEFMDPDSALWKTINEFMQGYGNRFRTFKHGAFHGFLTALTIILPVIAVTSMFERKSWKLIWINWGYWAVCFMLMGGVVCAWR